MIGHRQLRSGIMFALQVFHQSGRVRAFQACKHHCLHGPMASHSTMISRVRNSSRYLRRAPQQRPTQIDRSTLLHHPNGALFSSTTGGLTAIDANGGNDAADSTTPAYLHNLNPSQIDAVTQPLTAITRVIAGPGSGKTRVLTCRIAHLLQTDPYQRILAVTFTRKAANEMQQRLERIMSATDDDDDASTINGAIAYDDTTPSRNSLHRVSLGTFHSICAKILRWNGASLASLPTILRDAEKSNVDGNFGICDKGEQLQTLRECLKEAQIDLTGYDNLRPTNILDELGRCKVERAHGNDPFAVGDNKKPLSRKRQVVKTIYSLYRNKFLSTNRLDFDDLIFLARELLMEDEDLRDRLRRRWTHVLVDEFQDTSRTQMDLIKLLTSTSLLIVGDADQSIYSWRGAHVGSLSEFDTEFGEYAPDGVRSVYLMENYRSTANICKAAQKVISSGSNKTGADKMRQAMKPVRESGVIPRVVVCKDEKAEADFVVKTVLDLVTAGALNAKQSAAFIYRTNAQSRALEEACVKHNLAYIIFGSATSFYKRKEIKDCLCFLRWLHNGLDRSSMLRAMKTPSRGIGEVAIREFDEYCNAVRTYYDDNTPDGTPSPLEIIIAMTESGKQTAHRGTPQASELISKRSLKVLTAFAGQMRDLQEMAYELSVEKMLAALIVNFGLFTHFEKTTDTKAEFEECKNNVRELRQAAERYTKDGPCLQRSKAKTALDDLGVQTPLGVFLDDVALVTEMADDGQKVKDERFVASLMTIHASKGMEFDAVFVVGNEEGTFPTSQAILEGDGSVVLEEERRLCYVAMTRAKTDLCMTWREEVPIITTLGIRYVQKDRSRFLDALMGSKGMKATPTDPSSGSILPPLSVIKSIPPSLSQKRSVYGTPRRRTTHAAAKPALKFEGTASVFRQRSLNSLEYRVISQPAKPVPLKPGIRQLPDSAATPPKVVKKSSAVATEHVDSTWFFPVGTEVIHKKHGKGTVLAPRSNRNGEELLVRVKFAKGEERIPLHDNHLTPVWK